MTDWARQFIEVAASPGASSFLTRLSPLPKVSFTLAFLVLTVSFGRYDWLGCVVFAGVPPLLAWCGRLSLASIGKRSALALPFVLCAAIANLWFDRTPQPVLPNLTLTGGVVSLVTLTAKTMATTSMVLVLSSSTSISAMAGALVRLHVPCLLVLQIQLLCRYLVLTAEELRNLSNAYHVRCPGCRVIPVKDWAMLCGRLFLRSVERANAVYRAMQCRLFRADRALPAAETGSFVEWSVVAAALVVLGVLRYVLVAYAPR